MRVSFIMPHLGVYGGTRRIIEVSNRLYARGHEVAIFHPAGTPCEWLESDAPVRSTEEALSEDHDVLVYSDPSKETDRVVQRARANKAVFFVLSLPLPDDFLTLPSFWLYLQRDKRHYYTKKFLLADHMKVTTSSGMYDHLENSLGIDSELAVSGVNTDIFHPVGRNGAEKEIRILYSGDPRGWKNTATVFEALERLRRRNKNVVFDSYHNLNIPQRHMAKKYSSADIFVDAQLYGTWNNPVAEAMACKLAVVCTDIPGGKDFVFHEKTALVVDAHDSKSIIDAVERLVGNEQLRKRLSENALSHIRAFTWDKSIDKLEHILS